MDFVVRRPEVQSGSSCKGYTPYTSLFFPLPVCLLLQLTSENTSLRANLIIHVLVLNFLGSMDLSCSTTESLFHQHPLRYFQLTVRNVLAQFSAILGGRKAQVKHPSGFRRWSTTAPSCTPDQGNSHSSACVIYIHTCMEQKDCRRQINSAEEPAGTYYLKNLSLNWTVVVLLQSHPWQTVFENTQCTSSCLCIVRHCSLSVLHSTLGALNLYNL